MFLQILTLKYFEEQLHTYVIEKKDEYEIINLKDAKDIVWCCLIYCCHYDFETHIITKY